MIPSWRRRQGEHSREDVMRRIAEIVRERTGADPQPEPEQPTGDDSGGDEGDSYDLPDVPPGWGRR